MRVPHQINVAPIPTDPLAPDWFLDFVARYTQQAKRIAASLAGPTTALATPPLGKLSGAVTVSLARGDLITGTLTGNTTITIPLDQRTGAEGLLELTQDATGGWTVAWTNVVWTNSTPPVVAAGIGKKTLCGFTFNGVAWVGRVVASSY